MPWSIQYTRQWRDLPLRTKCLLLISAPAAATVLMFGMANLLAVRTAAAGDQANRALQAAWEIQRLYAADARMSANARAYFITRQESFVTQARSAIEMFTSGERALLNLTAGNPAQQQRLAQVASIESAREERMFGGLARFRNDVFPWDQLRVAVSEVEAQRLQMEGLLRAMDDKNTLLLEASLSRAHSLRAEQGAITGICLFLGLLGGVAMSLLFARGITGRIAILERNVAAITVGAAPDPLAGLDEIGSLNEGLRGVAELLRRKEVALENALHGIAEIGSDGRCLWLNKMYAEMTGCSRTLKPPQIAVLAQPEDRVRVEQAIEEMQRNGRSEIAARLDQFSGRTPDVGITFISTALEPGPGQGSTFYVFLRDIWAGKKADAALVRAKEAAEASNRAKTEFLAKISHDIRTPLNAILGSADLLSQTPLNFDQSEYVNMFQRNCRRLVSLINDFLDFARIEAGAVRVERGPFRVREVVLDAVATFREPAARKDITLGMEIDPAAPEWALGDPLRLQQVLVNLLSNALKFTPAGRVDVNVKVLMETSTGNQLRFEVSDSGAGIRLEDQDKIFARFVQLPNPTSGQRGTGLGLTICRDLVELMGGEIGVVSREGNGSTFYFNLPLESVEPGPASSDTVETGLAQLSPSAPIRILLAEDTEDNRLLLEHFLRDEPVKLRTATNGLEALNAVLEGEQFDLILMDIDMPEMDGYTATRKIRAYQQSQGPASGVATPIVALSADAMQDAVHASLEAGCVAHVAKPVDRETLLRTIRRFALAKAAPEERTPRTTPVSEQVMALVPHYLASKAQQIEEARTALASRDFGPIRRFGHNLKGTGRGYGFPPIEEMGREIERAAAEADADRIASQLDALHQFVIESSAPVNT
jgi:signal transduction histidine kinase/DNA-binding response OmpR family regulator